MSMKKCLKPYWRTQTSVNKWKNVHRFGKENSVIMMYGFPYFIYTFDRIPISDTKHYFVLFLKLDKFDSKFPVKHKKSVFIKWTKWMMIGLARYKLYLKKIKMYGISTSIDWPKENIWRVKKRYRYIQKSIYLSLYLHNYDEVRISNKWGNLNALRI